MKKKEIRKQSLSEAARLGYSTNENLPALDSIEPSRTLPQTIDRFLALYGVIACSYGYPKTKVEKWLSQEELSEYLSEREKQYINSETVPAQNSAIQWQIEALWTLAWCLSCHSNLDFSDSCSDDFIGMLPDIAKNESTNNFRDELVLRNSSEILAVADLTYCLHWSIRDAEIHSKTVPGKVPGNVVIERRRALEWMIGNDQWDDVELDT